MAEVEEINSFAKSGDEKNVGRVTLYILQHPLEMLILRWNWKAAFLSALLRAPIVFFSYFFAKDGLKMAVGAVIALSVYRLIFGGVAGAIIQSFSKVEPPWHAVITIPVALAALSHIFEYFVLKIIDFFQGSNGTNRALLLSVLMSVISAIFNLFAMRRGILLVKDETRQSIWKDLLHMPWLFLEFISFPLIWTWKRAKKSGT